MNPTDSYRALAMDTARIMARGVALAIIGVDVKSVRAIVGDYAVTLTTPVAAYFNGDGTLNRVRGVFNRSPKDYARDVYVEGMSEGKMDASEFDSDDQAVIDEWLSTQAGAVNGLVDAVREAGKAKGDARQGAQRGVFTRVGYWVDSLSQLGGLGRARAMDGVMVYWELGDTETHCDSCLSHSRERPHRMKWWRERGWLPKAHDLECGGWNCDCTLRSKQNGKVVYP